MELDPADQRPVYRQIVEEIQRCVAVGVMRPDEALPAAAALAKELKVNINTVQHAYRTLAQEGTVYIKRGLGTFVSPAPEGEPAADGRSRRGGSRNGCCGRASSTDCWPAT